MRARVELPDSTPAKRHPETPSQPLIGDRDGWNPAEATARSVIRVLIGLIYLILFLALITGLIVAVLRA